MIPDDVLVLAGNVPPALYLLSEAEDDRPWSDDLLTFCPSTVGAHYARWLWWELGQAVAEFGDGTSSRTVADDEKVCGNIRSLLARLLTGAEPCHECCLRLDQPFERLLNACQYRTHRQTTLRAVA